MILHLKNWGADLLWSAQGHSGALGMISSFPHSRVWVCCLQCDWNGHRPQNFMPRHISYTVSFEHKLWSSGVPLIRPQVCRFVGNMLACAKARLSFLCSMRLLLWQSSVCFSAKDFMVAVSGRGLCGPIQDWVFPNQWWQGDAYLSQGGWCFCRVWVF